MSSRYVIDLPSNGSRNFFPQNKANAYRNQLAEPLNLDGPHEIALLEIEYPLSMTVVDREIKASLLVFAREQQLPPHSGRARLLPLQAAEVTYHLNARRNRVLVPSHAWYLVVNTDIPRGYYNSPLHVAKVLRGKLIEEVAALMNESEELWAELFEVWYDDHTNVISFVRGDLACRLIIDAVDKHLAKIFGLTFASGVLTDHFDMIPKPKDPKQLIYKQFSAQSELPLMLHTSPSLWVYCDAVEPQLVGHERVPLLRSVTIEHGSTVRKEFVKPYYRPVCKQYINSLLIEIKDDQGHDIEFKAGKVNCVVEIRRCVSAV